MRKCIPFLLASVMTLAPLASLPEMSGTTITVHAQEATLSNPNASAEAQSLYTLPE